MKTEKRAVPSLPLNESIWLLSSFCTLHRISFDAALFSQRYPQPLPLEELSAPARELGLQLWHERITLSAALSKHLPLVIHLNEADGEKWALILNADESQLAVLRQGEQAPRYVAIAEIQYVYAGTALALIPLAVEASDPDGIEPRNARFGLRWFLPEDGDHGQDREHQQRQRHAVPEHDCNEDQQEWHIENRGHCCRGNELTDVLNALQTRRHHASRPVLEIQQRQPE